MILHLITLTKNENEAFLCNRTWFEKYILPSRLVTNFMSNLVNSSWKTEFHDTVGLIETKTNCIGHEFKTGKVKRMTRAFKRAPICLEESDYPLLRPTITLVMVKGNGTDSSTHGMWLLICKQSYYWGGVHPSLEFHVQYNCFSLQSTPLCRVM